MTTKPHTKRQSNRFKKLFEESVLPMVLLEDVALAQGAYIKYMQGLVDEFSECLNHR